MKRITQSEAAKLRTTELYSLRRAAFTAFSGATRDSQDQRDALATMRAVEAVLKQRGPVP